MAFNRNKHKNVKLRHFLKVFFLSLLGLSVVAFGIFIGVIVGFVDTTGGLNIDDINLDFTSFVYYLDENGNEIEYEELYRSENRIWTDFAEIPEHVKKAAVAIEDERFDKHIGFDIKSTAYATYSYLFKKSTSRGASTITQQLVKNLTGDKDKSPIRKVREIISAIGLESKMTKDEILEMYLNTIYLGHNCNGIGSAASYYFDKLPSELTAAEGAAIIGITQYPTLYDPISNPEENKKKQETVLYKMHQLGYLNDKEYNDALAQELVFIGNSKPGRVSIQSYFVDELIREVTNDLQEELGYTEAVATKMLYTGGLKIYCTVDPDIQSIMEKVYDNESSIQKLSGDIQPQSSMTVIDPHTGYIKGIVGGRGKKTADMVLNRASQSFRQPGSAIKPIAVYGPAVDKGIISPGSVWQDKPITYGSWSPQNYSRTYSGGVTIRYAVQRSLNTIPVEVLNEMGVATSYSYLTQKLGITSLVETDKNLAALALGGLTKGISTLEMSAAYVPFINEGTYIEPVTYTKIVSHSGKVVFEKEQRKSKAFSKESASVTLDMLKSVVTSGTGTEANLSGYSVAGKTGTTDDDYDRWFVGITPYYVGTVWVGYDSPRSLRGFSGNPAARVWKNVMQQIHKTKELPSKKFDGITAKYQYLNICADSGLLATQKCEHDHRGTRIRSDIFVNGNAPTSYCHFDHIAAEPEDEPENGTAAETEEKPSSGGHTAPSQKPSDTTVSPPHGDGGDKPVSDGAKLNPDMYSESGL